MQDLDKFHNIPFMFGDRLMDRFPADATVLIRSNRPPTDYFKAGPFPVLSSRVRAVLDKFAVHAEFLRVSVALRNGDPSPGEWFCFNVLEVVDCLDRAKSQFTQEQNYAIDIGRVAINEEACRAAPLVLAAKTIPELVVVRDDVAEAIQAAGCSGVVLKDPREWTNPVYPVR
jgi:hypothetical protein